VTGEGVGADSTRDRNWRGLLAMGLLAALPVIAYAPAVVEGRLLAPGRSSPSSF
jgi:hypothetical protein